MTVPIYQTSTYVQEEVGVHKGYDYSRVANPTRTALQTCLASLEGAEHGIAFSSGLGATTTIMHLVNPGERVVCVNDVYGGVYRMFSQVYEPKGYEFAYVPAPEEMSTNLADHLDERTRLVWIETPTNPLLNIVDIRAAAEAAHAVGALVVVDNTFATPYLQQPLALGADVVVHSLTKYLGGHSDLIGGFAATNDPTIAERLLFLQKSLGAVPGPVRLLARPARPEDARRAHARSTARTRAPSPTFLADAPARREGALPRPAGPSRPRDRRAPDARLRRHGLVPRRDARRRPSRSSRARSSGSLAESLGGVESLIEHPGADDARVDRGRARSQRRGTSSGSRSGIESADDLIADLAQALVRSPAAAGA